MNYTTIFLHVSQLSRDSSKPYTPLEPKHIPDGTSLDAPGDHQVPQSFSRSHKGAQVAESISEKSADHQGPEKTDISSSNLHF